jgi:photosystem II stability/assembly factor-like uncharacterized protein
MHLQFKSSPRSFLSISFCGLSVAGMWMAQPPARRPVEPKPNQSTDPILHSFEFRSIGPAVMMGRLDDIQGTAKDPMLLYIGFATGGLWKSTDGGNHWHSQFDNFANESIGAISIAPSDPNVVYVGTGEANNRQSSSIGDGVWGTTDGGKTWNHLGLENTQSINRIAVDPTNPNIVFVASPGHLFGPNPDRGLYRSTDGGKTWKNVKYIDENTGFNDVAIDPVHPKIVYASSFERRRNGWGYNGGGPNGGLWKSVDGGNTWTKLDGPGWPKPKDGLYGRIAIAIFAAKPTTIYAQVEAGASAGTGSGTLATGGEAPPGRDEFGGEAPPEAPAAVPATAKPGTPAPAAAGTPAAPAAAATPGAAPGATAPGGRPAPPPPDPNGNGVFRSDDGGKTWTFVSNQNQRPTYFSQIRVDPKNVNKLFVGGTPGQMSLDGGKTWKGLTGSHTDYHAIWINPADTRIVAVGHDGGLDISNDGGFTWDYHNDIAVGQFYQVSADMRHPYFVCGGLQDNNAWCGPSALRSSTGGVNTDWYTVAGGDGFYTRQDPTDWGIIYAESQDGEMARHDLHAATQKSIKPTVAPPPAAAAPGGAVGRGRAATVPTTPPANENPTPTNPTATNPTAGSAPAEAAAAEAPAPGAGTTPPAAGGRRGRGQGGAAGAGATPAEPAAGGGGFGRQVVPNVSNAPKDVAPFRFYWNAPFEISPHNPAVIYMAAQFFFKSTNRGDSWTMNPKDLTKNLPRWSASRPIMGVPGDKPMVAKHDGYSSSSLATQVRESPSKPGVIWIGTDDGNLQISQDGGDTFTNVYANIAGAPQGYIQISRIEPSHFDPAAAYVALDAHREDDWAPYLYKTTDYGKTWTNVTANLPAKGNINALREDLENPDLLFVGTEFGMFVSLDGAKSWQKFNNGMPSVRVDDILIHPRDRDLIVGTHGRSIWIMDDISPLEQLKKTGADLMLFEPRSAILWKNDIQAQRHVANREFVGENPQGGTAIRVLAKKDMGKGKVEFLLANKVVSTMDIDVKAGLNSYQWNMRGPAPAGNQNRRRNFPIPEMVPSDPNAPPTPPPAPGAAPEEPTEVPFVSAGGFGGGGFRRGPVGPLLEPGTYMIRLTVGGQTLTSSVDVLEDVWLNQ